jgi:hypothetical protein
MTERSLSQASGLSRAAVRCVEAPHGNVTIDSIAKVARAVDRSLYLIASCHEGSTDCSTVAVALSVVRDGESSWKIHFMNLVDEFRRTLDPLLMVLEPPPSLPLHLRALLASIVCALTEEATIDAPAWCQKRWWLPSPWFVSGIEALKASAIVESPLCFRRNNIFVQDNFLQRA